MTPNRLIYLEGLRGILAVIVFVHHFLYAFFPECVFGGNFLDFSHTGPMHHLKLIALTPLNILFNPGIAIHFFFLLSGFVQSIKYFKNPDLEYLQKSFFKRYFRLALPTLAVLLLVFVFYNLNWIHKEYIPVSSLSGDWTKSLFSDNFSLLQLLVEGLYTCFMGNTHYYPILWTMPAELQNSFMIFILLMATHNVKNKKIVFGFWILVQLFVIRGYYSVAFTIGVLLAMLENDSEAFKRNFSMPLIKYSCLVLGIYFGSYPYTGYQNATQHSVYKPISFFETYPHIISYLIGSVLLLCFLLRSTNSQKFLSSKIIVFYGKISFMFYLLHFIILFSFTPCLFHVLNGSMSNNLTLLLSAVASFILITIVSYAFTALVDKPVLKLCSSLIKRVFQK